MKVVLVHDYLREYGGAERVLEALHQIFPQAPVFTAYYNPKTLGVHAKRFASWDIRTSWLQKLPFANKLISPLRIFAPMIFESFNLNGFDVIISSCSIYFSKAVIAQSGSLHISYIHTPPRYLYGYATSFNYRKNPLTRIIGELANHFLRIYDYKTSQRPDILVANSKNVQARINKFYRREAVMIYPPVDVEKLKAGTADAEQNSKLKNTSQNRKEYYLSVSRLVRGKGVDIIVKACTKLGLPLKVVGVGPILGELKKTAGKNIEFVGQVDDRQLAKLYFNAKALIVAAEDEDFGITPVEAQACGTPVIAVNNGGYLETIVDGKTGEFFNQVSVEGLTEVLQKFNPEKYSARDCIKQSEKFSEERFQKEILKLINANMNLESKKELPL